MKDHLVVTMSDRKYFKNGYYFLKTINRVDADFLLYTPTGSMGVDSEQKTKLRIKDVEVRQVDSNKWLTMMQTLKFYYLYWNLLDYKYITFCDFDTYFVNDWKHVFESDFTLGVTTTEGFPQWQHLRSKTNGGVIFCKGINGAMALLNSIVQTIKYGKNTNLLEYDEIWKTLEDPKRGPNKQKFRTDLAWWCDQVALSALLLNRFEDVKAFKCVYYNVLESAYKPEVELGVYIRHLKGKNRIVQGVSCG